VSDDALRRLAASLGADAVALPAGGRFVDCALRDGRPVLWPSPERGELADVLTGLREAARDPDQTLPGLLCDLRRGHLLGLRFGLRGGRPAVSERGELQLPLTAQRKTVLDALLDARRQAARMRLALRFGSEFCDERALDPRHRWVLADVSRTAGVFPAASFAAREEVPAGAHGALVDVEADELLLEPLNTNGAIALVWTAPEAEIHAQLGAR
jgi:hypothetical protein